MPDVNSHLPVPEDDRGARKPDKIEATSSTPEAIKQTSKSVASNVAQAAKVETKKEPWFQKYIGCEGTFRDIHIRVNDNKKGGCVICVDDIVARHIEIGSDGTLVDVYHVGAGWRRMNIDQRFWMEEFEKYREYLPQLRKQD